MTIKEKIIDYLTKENRIVHKGELGKIAVNEWGIENENLGRRCRELENEKKIIRHEDDKGRVMYSLPYSSTVLELKKIMADHLAKQKKETTNQNTLF